MKKFDQINVIPFIDIMLVLLAIVLTSASFIAQGKIPITPPTSSTTTALEASDQNSHLITINKQGEYHLDDQRIALSALERTIASWDSNASVHLSIDAEAPFARFIQVGDLLRARNINRVNILATPTQNTATP